MRRFNGGNHRFLAECSCRFQYPIEHSQHQMLLGSVMEENKPGAQARALSHSANRDRSESRFCGQFIGSGTYLSAANDPICVGYGQ